MKRFLIAVLVGVGIGYALMRLSNRHLLTQELDDEDDIEDIALSRSGP